MKYIIICILYIIMFSIAGTSQPGSLDSSFGNDGIAFVSRDLADCNSLALQQDGKVVSASSSVINSTNGFTLSRTNPDGSIDLSFGNDGLVFTGIPGGGVVVESVNIQEDGKIVAAGYNDYQDDIGMHFVEIVVIRYNQDGSIDNSFGINGIATANVGIKSYVTCMAIQADGKIIVAGNRLDDENDNDNLFMVRFLTDGTLDEGFGNNGILLEDLGTPIKVNGITIQPEDGKIILGGMYPSSDKRAFFLIRYLPNGSRSDSFGINGQGKINFPTGVTYSILREIAVQPDGKFVAAGVTQKSPSLPIMTVVRFKTNGYADSSFGENGIVYIHFGEDKSDAKTIVVQNDGKIIPAGFNSPANFSYSHFAIARLKSDGSLDSSFATNGLKTDSIIDGQSIPTTGLLQNDGKLVLATTYYTLPGALFLVRYNTEDAILPITYNKFTAQQRQQYITLNWQTALELNNKYFAIERSSNAISYSSIAQVKASGPGETTIKSYSYTDRLPLEGTNYYRLKQTDADGKYSYSKVVAISFLKPGSIQLFPNPAKNSLHVEGLSATEKTKLSILDFSGYAKLVTTATGNSCNFNIAQLKPGNYMLLIETKGNVATKKFVK